MAVQAFVSRAGATESREVSMFVQFWNREGQPTGRVGLEAARHPNGGSAVAVTNPLQGYADSDSSAVLVMDGEVWLSRLTPGSVRPLLMSADVVREASRFDPRLRQGGLHPVAVTPGSGGGYWVLAVTRVLGSADEDGLIRQAPKVPGYMESMRAPKANSPIVANQVWDGLLLNVGQSGEISAYHRFDEVPHGFVGPTQYFTFREQAQSGLLSILVHDFAPRCAG